MARLSFCRPDASTLPEPFTLISRKAVVVYLTRIALRVLTLPSTRILSTPSRTSVFSKGRRLESVSTSSVLAVPMLTCTLTGPLTSSMSAAASWRPSLTTLPLPTTPPPMSNAVWIWASSLEAMITQPPRLARADSVARAQSERCIVFFMMVGMEVDREPASWAISMPKERQRDKRFATGCKIAMTGCKLIADY